jgi:AAA15 family ATPase/GTPase
MVSLYFKRRIIMKYLGELFDEHPVHFPLDSELIMLTGENGTGKTKVLEMVKDYFEGRGDNVLYFPHDRRFTASKKSIKKLLMEERMNNNFLKKMDIDISSYLKFNYIDRGMMISSGIEQLLNFFGNIMDEREDKVVIIDCPERSLHISTLRTLIDCMLDTGKIEKLFIVTNYPFLIGNKYMPDIMPIEECVELYKE